MQINDMKKFKNIIYLQLIALKMQQIDCFDGGVYYVYPTDYDVLYDDKYVEPSKLQ